MLKIIFHHFELNVDLGVPGVYDFERGEVLDTARKAYSMGFVAVAEGNFSVRVKGKNLFAITPSAIEYDRMVVDDVVVIDYEGNVVYGERKPSSEWRLHAYIYKKRQDVNAIVHTHSLYVSVLSVMGEGIPVIIDEQVIYVKGTIDVSEYAMTGTWELAENVYKALGDKRAAIIKNHGLVTVGESADIALNVALIAEKIAKIYYLAKAGGKVDTIPQEVIDKLRYATYGKY